MASRDMGHGADKDEWEVAALLRPAGMETLCLLSWMVFSSRAHEPGCWGWW